MSNAAAIHQAYRYALDPSSEQKQFLAACAGASRFWFNQGLALVRRRLDERSNGTDVVVPWSYKSLCIAFRGNAIKDQLAPWHREVVIGSYQSGLEALGRALQNYSVAHKAGRKVAFPCFRSKGRCHEAVIFQRPRIPDSRHVMLDRRLGPMRTKESMRKLVRLLRSIGVETLAVKNMLANGRLARHVADAGWGMFLAQLRYKASWSDSVLVAADRFYPSSKTCSACGAVKAKLRLADRVFSCDERACGHVQDRDVNAARNLARMAQRHAQTEGNCMVYVARTGRFTLSTARGGQVRLVHLDERSPVKREASQDASQRGDALALAP